MLLDPRRQRDGTQVLVVDDNELVRSVVVKILEAAGFETTEVANGKEAVETCEELDFDVIVMDYHMPIMNGLEAAKAIRSGKDRSVPILCLSGHCDSLRSELSDAGADRFLPKPVRPIELVEVVSCLARTRRPA